MSQSHANRRGIIAIIAATGAFAGNDAIVKLVAREYPLGEVVFVRGLMTCGLVLAVLLWLGHLAALRFTVNRVVVERSAFEALSMLLFTAALIRMPLASLSTIVSVSPLILTALSVIFFKEIVGWRRWTAIGVGFVGALFVVKPTPGAFDVWAVLGLACACSSACRDIMTRRLPAGIPSIVVSFSAAVSVTIAGLGLGLWEDWRPMDWPSVGLLGVAAVFLGAANFCVVMAYRGVEIAVVGPFRYSIMIWASVTGYLVFGEIPDSWAAIGAALIVGSGVYALHREAIRARQTAAALRSEAAPP